MQGIIISAEASVQPKEILRYAAGLTLLPDEKYQSRDFA